MHSTLKHKVCTEWVIALCFSTYPVAVWKQTPPCPHSALLLNWFLRTHQKIWVTEVLLTSFWEGSPRCKFVHPAFSALVFLPLFHGFLPLRRVRHQLGKAWLCFPGCCSEACCKMSLAHGGRKTQKHMMYLEKLKIISQGSDSKLCKWEELHQLQEKAGWK